ncbi:M14 family zinc carboxypeptidase [Paenibacillus marinisediminis]
MAIPYIVQKGDTHLRISLRYGVNIQALMAHNPQLRPDEYVIPGQLIQIPQNPPNLYVIQQDDTFYSIASQFRVPIQWLANANPMVHPRKLIPGHSIMIPYWSDERDAKTRAEYGPAQLMDDVDRLQARYPFIRMEKIGESVMGKPIFALCIGTGPNLVHANGAVHANEWLTSAALMQFFEDYASHYAACTSWQGWDSHAAYARNTLCIVPMVNPDGVELVQEGITPRHPYAECLLEWNDAGNRFSGWKANIRGVDLNDQFPAHWEEECRRRGVHKPAPMNYGGTQPLTEPEAAALAAYVERMSFDIALSFHSQGQEIYWNYRGYEPPESQQWAKQLQNASGYRAVALTGSDAGFKDWFIQSYRRPGFTVELGLGVNPLPLDQFERVYLDVCHIMKSVLNGLHTSTG